MKLEEWAQGVAKKIEGRVAEEAERAVTARKRFEEGVERYRKQILDLVATVNALVPTDATRVQIIRLDNGLVLSAGYKRISTLEEPGSFPEDRVPACVGRIVVERENRRSGKATETEKIYITSSGAQITLYHQPKDKLEIVTEPKYREFVEYFAT